MARAFCEGWATFEENTLRDGLITPKNFTGEKPVLMLDAHGDEVGGMVKAVLSNGTMSFVELGRFTPGDARWPGRVGARDRRLLGARRDRREAAALPERGRARLGKGPALILDVGARSYEEAVNAFHMGMGEPIVPDTAFSYDAARGVALGKAFDCRAGVCAMLLALRELSRRDRPARRRGGLDLRAGGGRRARGGCGRAALLARRGVPL